jgi:hypothetical protein
MFAENVEYEILTPSGWQDFRGITSIENKIVYCIQLSDGSYISGTEKHILFVNNHQVTIHELQIGDFVDTVNGTAHVLSITQESPTTVYDIIEVSDINHQYIVNEIITKNCDELSYVEPNIARGFWTSISPTLATGGKALITSTPNSDEDQFADIWHEANKRFDEFGNEQELGKNGFFPYLATWDQHPDRDQAWANSEMSRIGEEKFKREHNCLAHSTNITLQDTLGNIFTIPIGDLYNLDCDAVNRPASSNS